jgi:hypothetical protein
VVGAECYTGSQGAVVYCLDCVGGRSGRAQPLPFEANVFCDVSPPWSSCSAVLAAASPPQLHTDFIYLTAPLSSHSTNPPPSMPKVLWAVAGMLHSTLHAKPVGQRKFMACRCFTGSLVQPLRHRHIYARLVALYGETPNAFFVLLSLYTAL